MGNRPPGAEGFEPQANAHHNPSQEVPPLQYSMSQEIMAETHMAQLDQYPNNQQNNTYNAAQQSIPPPPSNDQHTRSRSAQSKQDIMKAIGGKCAHIGCRCNAFKAPTSKWSKGKCKTCNHTENEHQQASAAHYGFDHNKAAKAPKQNLQNVNNNKAYSKSSNMMYHAPKLPPQKKLPDQNTQSQTVFNPNVNNLESNTPPPSVKSPTSPESPAPSTFSKYNAPQNTSYNPNQNNANGYNRSNNAYNNQRNYPQKQQKTPPKRRIPKPLPNKGNLPTPNVVDRTRAPNKAYPSAPTFQPPIGGSRSVDISSLQATGAIKATNKESVYMDMTIAEVERMQAKQGNLANKIPTANLDKTKTVRQILEEQKQKSSAQSQAKSIAIALKNTSSNPLPKTNPWNSTSTAWNNALGPNTNTNTNTNTKQPSNNTMNKPKIVPAPIQKNYNQNNNYQNRGNNTTPTRSNKSPTTQRSNATPPSTNQNRRQQPQNLSFRPDTRMRAVSDQSSTHSGNAQYQSNTNYNQPRPFQKQIVPQRWDDSPDYRNTQNNNSNTNRNTQNNVQSQRNNTPPNNNNNNTNRNTQNNVQSQRNNTPPNNNNNNNNNASMNRFSPKPFQPPPPSSGFKPLEGFQPATAGGLTAKSVGQKMGGQALEHHDIVQPKQNPWDNQKRSQTGFQAKQNASQNKGPRSGYRPPPPKGNFQPQYQGQKYNHNFKNKSYNKKEVRQKKAEKQRQSQHKQQKGQYPPPEKLNAMDGTNYDSDESVFVTQAEIARRHSWGSSSLEATVNRQPFGKPVSVNQSNVNTFSSDSDNPPHHGKTEEELVNELELTEKEFYKKYWIEDGTVGSGSFAKVRKVTRKKDKKEFALKMIKKAGKSKEDLEALQREIGILAKLSHPNVVKLMDWCETKKRIYMVVQFCSGGDVFERILKQKTFSEKEAAHVVRKVAEGLKHVHSNHIIHRDLKPDNLMYLTKSETSNIMIIDFGLAGDASTGPLSTPCGTAHYVAPEVLSSKPYNSKADMWSLGVIIYMLLCGFPPFFDAQGNQKRLYKLIKLGKYRFPSPYWDYVGDEAKDLIKNLLQLDPEKRYSADQCLTHKWINKSAEIENIDLGQIYMEQMEHFSSSRHFVDQGLKLHSPGTAKIGGVGGTPTSNQQHQKRISYFKHQQHAPKFDDDW